MVFFSLLPYTTIFDAIKRTLRKSAFWTGDVTEKRILRAGPHGKAHSGRPLACRMRLSVRVTPQSAPFRESDTSECVFT